MVDISMKVDVRVRVQQLLSSDGFSLIVRMNWVVSICSWMV